MPATAGWPSAATSALRSAGPMSGVTSTSSQLPDAPIASEALQRIAALYEIEKNIRGRNAEERRLVRQQKSRPLIDALEPWLRAKLGLISQKGKLAEAIRYALSRWEGLTRFIDDGRIELDNIPSKSKFCPQPRFKGIEKGSAILLADGTTFVSLSDRRATTNC